MYYFVEVASDRNDDLNLDLTAVNEKNMFFFFYQGPDSKLNHFLNVWRVTAFVLAHTEKNNNNNDLLEPGLLIYHYIRVWFEAVKQM